MCAVSSTEADKNTSTNGAGLLVRARGLSKTYARRGWLWRKQAAVRAIEGVDLAIRPGATMALVGESGSGKSTLAMCLACLEEPDAGEIWFEGRNLRTLSREELVAVRRRIQLVFQDSATALNPRFSAAEIVEEPLVIQKQGAAKERRARALDLMRKVGLLPEWAHRRPLEFSGGQRQRLAIARALAVRPRFMIFDEALSGLDLSIQGQIVNLLLDLQAAYALTYLFISHDLGLIARFCDRVAVMHQGKIVEEAEPATLWKDAQHAHTRALMASLAFLQSAHAAASR